MGTRFSDKSVLLVNPTEGDEDFFLDLVWSSRTSHIFLKSLKICINVQRYYFVPFNDFLDYSTSSDKKNITLEDEGAK